MHSSTRFAGSNAGERPGRRGGSTAWALRLLVLAGVLGLGLLHTAATPRAALASCGFREMYGPFGAVVGSSFSATIGLTTCLPDAGVVISEIGVDTRPQIDWGGGSGFEAGNISVNSRGDCLVGCRIGGSHTYVTAGPHTVRVKYFVVGFEVDSPSITVYANPAPPAPGVDTAGWMGALRDNIGDLPLSEIVIPATHDTGAIGFSLSSIVAPDFPPAVVNALTGLSGKLHNSGGACSDDLTGTCAGLLDTFSGLFGQAGTHFVAGGHLDGIYSPIGDTTAQQAIAQDTTVTEQLNGGIRLLDIRLCTDINAPDTFRFCHSLYGGPFVDVLPDIKRFIVSHPTELIFLDIHNVNGLDGSINGAATEPLHEALIQSLRQMFSTDGSCASQAACLLVSSSFVMTNTLNQILATPGRVIVLDGDSNVVNWEKTNNPSNPILWDESSQTASSFVDGLTDFTAFRANMFNDVRCRCNSSPSATDRKSHPELLFPLGMSISADKDLILSELLERLIDKSLSDSLGPEIAASILGSGYKAVGSDVTDGPVLAAIAGLANPLNLDSLYAAVVANPDLRIGVNWLSTDFFERSNLVPVAIALNKITPAHFNGRAVELNGTALQPTYQTGTWSKFPVDVFYDCFHSDDTVVMNVDVQHITADTPAAGSFVSPILDCFSSGRVFAAPLSYGPVMVDMTPPVISHDPATDTCSLPIKNGWCSGVPSATFSVTDALSGVASPCTAAAGRSCTFTVAGTAGATTISSGPVCDVAGSCATAQAGPLKLDTQPPTVKIGGLDANGHGWVTASPATGTVGANDAGSGVADITCTDGHGGLTLGSLSGGTTAIASRSVSLVGDGTHTLSCTATDLAGNISPSETAQVRVDAAPPVISTDPAHDQCSLPGTNGWCRGTQTAGFSVTDVTSGVGKPCTAAPGASCSFTRSTATEGTAVRIASGTADDVAGNSSPDSSAGPFKLDKTPPALSLSAFSANSSGWVTVGPATDTVTATDATSGVASIDCTDDHSGLTLGTLTGGSTNSATRSLSVSGDGVHHLTCTATDVAGNSSGAQTLAVQLDTTPPVISADASHDSCSLPGTNGWCRGRQTAGFSVTDASSGVTKPCTAAAGASCQFTRPISTDGTSIHVVSGLAADVAGNTNLGITTGPFNVDTQPPTLSLSGFSPNASGWITAGPATGTASATDATSGVASIDCTDDHSGLTLGTLTGGSTGSTGSAARSLSLSGDGVHHLACTATDVAGNPTGTQTLTVKLDTVPPGLPSLAFTPNGSNGWFKTAPAMGTVTASDPTSGVVSISCQDTLNGLTLGSFTALAAGGGSRTLQLSGEGSHVLSCTATDAAGNTSGPQPGTVKLDTTAPVVTVTGPQSGTLYTGVVPAPVCHTTDATSGVGTAATLHSMTAPLAGQPGVFQETDTCSAAVDMAGNAQAAVVSVTYTFKRKLSPI